MVQEDLPELVLEVLHEIARDFLSILPKMLVAIVVLAAAILVVRVLNRLVGKILKLVRLDGIFLALTKTELPFSASGVIIALIDVGILLIALFGLANLFLGPQHTELVLEVFAYGARIVSVIAITILTFVMFSVLIDRMSIETRMRGYVVFIVLILITMMVIDLTNLSPSTKQGVVNGLSIGLGISVGVFAVWFFFHDLFEKVLALKTGSEEECKPKDSQT